jgi:hypothetical protein
MSVDDSPPLGIHASPKAEGDIASKKDPFCKTWNKCACVKEFLLLFVRGFIVGDRMTQLASIAWIQSRHPVGQSWLV